MQDVLKPLLSMMLPLGTANALSILQCRWNAFSKPAHPLVGSVQADSGVSSSGLALNALLEAGTDQTQPAPPLPAKMMPLHPDHLNHQGA
jgi:hypothetical protein